MAPTRPTVPHRPLPDHVELTIDQVLPDGDGVARWEGETIKVRFVLPGERVRVHPFWAKGGRRAPPHLRADLVEVIEPHPGRVDPACRYFGQCGGCQYQHLDYQAQLDLKQEHLAQALAAYPTLAGIWPAPVIGCPGPYGYRNQLRLSLDGHARLCFTLAGRRRTFPVERCPIAADPINDLLAELQGHYQGRHQVALRVGFRTGDRLVFPPDAGAPGGSAPDALTDTILGHTFRIRHSSFFQVNTRPFERSLPPELADLGWPARGAYSQADFLALLVIEGLGLTGTERLIDAYAGVGVFARILAGRCREVVAIEEAGLAVADARHNLAGQRNVSVHQGKSEVVLPSLDGPSDAVILDPARPGCAPALLDALIDRSVPRIVYVSCAPATLARDLDRLAPAYRIDWIRPLDMFPQTRHLETVVCLSRRRTGSHRDTPRPT